mgnify:CR=1 FL=1
MKCMTSEEKRGSLIVGSNQVKKALRRGMASLVYVAHDADAGIRFAMFEICRECGVPVDETKTVKELGEMCRIEVGCAVCAEKRF